MLTDFKERLIRGDTFIGAFVCLPCPESAEVLAEIGYDWLILDTEHGPYGVLEAQRALQAVGRRCPCVVRVPANDDVWIKKALDIGATGVLVPEASPTQTTCDSIGDRAISSISFSRFSARISIRPLHVSKTNPAYSAD